jgi:hypothetical protein
MTEQREVTMRKSATNLLLFFGALTIFTLMGCAGGNRGILKVVQKPTEKELRQDWEQYTVYYRPYVAIVFKIKGYRKIILGKSWIKVSSEGMMAKSKILDSAWVKEIIGNNGEMFGYLVHRIEDMAHVNIIDESTVRVYYRYRRTEGGP